MADIPYRLAFSTLVHSLFIPQKNNYNLSIMSLLDTKAIIYIALANDKSGLGEGFLAELEREKKLIVSAFQKAADDGIVRLIVSDSASADDIFSVFNAPENKDRIALFHYAGHAGGAGLHLELEETIGNRLANASGLAGLFSNQTNLKLVFLNGCSTKKQVEVFRAAKIPNIVATGVSIDDGVAVKFAEHFYQSLAGFGTIAQAFENAQNYYRTQFGSDLRGEKRLWKVEDEALPAYKPKDGLPWELHAAEPDWSLSKWRVIVGPQPNVNVFVAYSEEDTDVNLAKELLKHLKLLQRQKVIEAFGGLAMAGSDIEEDLRRKLTDARIILLCLSSDFLASDRCALIEEIALQRRNEKSVIVVPVLFRPYDSTGYEFAKLQPLPFNGRAVTKWANKDEAFTDIAAGLRSLIMAMTKQR